MDPTFNGTREFNLAKVLWINKALVDAVENSDVEAFSTALKEFDRMTKLDEWKTTLLLRVKNTIQDDEEDFT